MSEADGMHHSEGDWVTASGIATFVFCERKYALSRNPPEGYSEPPSVTSMKKMGDLYHKKKGRMLVARLLAQHLLLLAGVLLLIGAVAMWYLL